MKKIELKYINESYGNLTILESNQIPFQIKRVYWLTKNTTEQSRGCHAHKKLKQIFLTIQGSAYMTLRFRNGESQEVEMSNTAGAVLLDNCTWKEIYPKSNDFICCVLVDADYDENDYIRTLEDYYKYNA